MVESNRTGKPIVGVEMGRDTLSIFAMTPIMRDGKSVALAENGIPFGKEFVERAKQRFGVDLAVHSFDGKELKRLSSTFDSAVATPEELKSVFSGASLRRDAELGGRPAALYLGQIKNYAGQPVAVLEVVKDTTEYEAAAASSQRNLILGTIAILAGAVLLAFLLGRGLSRPLTAITAVMNRLSGGDTEVTIPGGDRKDELGTMAVAVDVFRRSMMEAGAMRAAQEAAKQQAEAEKKALQRQMADRFEADVKSVVSAVAKRDQGHAARRRRDHGQRQRHLGAGHRRGGCFRRGIGQRQHGRRRHRGTGVFRGRDRPPGHAFQQRRRRRRGQGRTNHRNGREPHGCRRKDRRRASPDRRHRQPDQPAGAQCDDRGGARRRRRHGALPWWRPRSRNWPARPRRQPRRSPARLPRSSPPPAIASPRSAASATPSAEISGIATTIAAAVEEQDSATREIARSVQQAAAGTSEVSLNVAGASQAADQSRILANNVMVASGELNQQATALFESVDSFLAGLRNAA